MDGVVRVVLNGVHGIPVGGRSKSTGRGKVRYVPSKFGVIANVHGGRKSETISGSGSFDQGQREYVYPSDNTGIHANNRLK